jgi:hypothetical protein
VGDQLLREASARLLNVRKLAHEEIIFTGNVAVSVTDAAEFDKAVNALRRLERSFRQPPSRTPLYSAGSLPSAGTI